MRKVLAEEKLWIGRDFNRRVGSDNTSRKEIMGKLGYDDKNGGEALVAFVTSHNSWMANTFYKKAPRHRITYHSGGSESQIYYILLLLN